MEDQIDVLRWINIVREEINDKSDRALVITIASILDVQLEKVLKTFFINDSKIDEKLFGSNSPLSTFSSKNSMCYYLGIISKYEYNTIEIIRKIRNKFAHEIETKNMSDNQSIVDLCDNLKIPKELYIPESITFSKDGKIKQVNKQNFEKMEIKAKFIKVFENITMYLEYRIVEILKQKRIEYKNISYLQTLKDAQNQIINLNKQYYEYNLKYKKQLLQEYKIIRIIIDDKQKHSLLKNMLDVKDEEINKIIMKIADSPQKALKYVEKELERISNIIKAYEEGDLFYGETIENNIGSKVFDKLMNITIDAIENEEDNNWYIKKN